MNKTVTTTVASLAMAAGLSFAAIAPAQAVSTPWTGPGYSEPSHTEYVVPVCSAQDFNAFSKRNLDAHFADANNYAITARSVYGGMFSSPTNFLRSISYTVIQTRNFISYPIIDLSRHYKATATAYPNGC